MHQIDIKKASPILGEAFLYLYRIALGLAPAMDGGSA